ncbi:serine/threonine-protein phosphatase 4 regulatory subunit 3, partial [Tanacetum coccineum]
MLRAKEKERYQAASLLNAMLWGSILPEFGPFFQNLKEGKLPLLPSHSVQFHNILKVDVKKYNSYHIFGYVPFSPKNAPAARRRWLVGCIIGLAETAKESWRRRDITNFEYFMILNTLPWVLAAYTSDVLDFNKSSTFHDLLNPVGALDQKRCNFLLNGTLDKVLCLTRRREKYLVVAAVRFMRTLISHNDENLAYYIAKNNVLKPIVDAFICNGSRYNLLNSAVLDLFEHIRKENIKILLKYLVETFWDQLVKFNRERVRNIQDLTIESAVFHSSVGGGGSEEFSSSLSPSIDEEDSASAASASTPRTTRVRAQPSTPKGSDASCPPV